MRTNFKTATAICAALAATAFGGAAYAQTVDELTIFGSRDGAELSAAVNYSDLDLRDQAAQKVLKERVKDTAKGLCERLGEPRGSTSVAPSCVESAVGHAAGDVNKAIESAPSRMAMAAPPHAAPYMAPMGAAADTSAQVAPLAPAATFSSQTVTNGPVPDTAENRARFGGPMSRAGKRSDAASN